MGDDTPQVVWYMAEDGLRLVGSGEPLSSPEIETPSTEERAETLTLKVQWWYKNRFNRMFFPRGRPSYRVSMLRRGGKSHRGKELS